jgi:hypothetical protein
MALVKINSISTFETTDSFYDISLYQDDYEKQTFYLDGFEIHNCFIITGKKRYAAKVLDNEYVRYDAPEYKFVGLTLIATTCPAICRQYLKEAVIKMLNGATNDEIMRYNDNFKKVFLQQKPEDISIPKGVNGIGKYDTPNGFPKGTPIHSRAAVLFNRALEKLRLTSEYPTIKEGDKIKYTYLKLPNIIGENVIGYVEKIPPEFKLDKYVDYETMFDKTYMSQMTTLMGSMKWVAKDKGSLDW